MLRQTACFHLLSEEVKGQCFVRIQMEPLRPKLFVLSFFKMRIYIRVLRSPVGASLLN